MKTCSKCGRSRAKSDFHKCKSAKDGHYAYCKDCAKIRNSEYYYADQDARKAYMRQSYRDNLEQKRAYHREYKRRNPEGNRASAQRYRERNLDKCLTKCREYKARNPAKCKQYVDIRRAKKRSAKIGAITPHTLAQRWRYYSDRCWICGDAATATDHVKPLSKGGAHMLCNLRPVCQTCNSRKHAKWPLTVTDIERIKCDTIRP